MVNILVNDGVNVQEMLLEALAIGLKKPLNIVIAFTALYGLTITNDLPQELYQRVVKIASVCPAMAQVLRHLAQKRVRDQRIVIDEAEKTCLAATDLAEVRVLVAEVARFVPELQTVWDKVDNS